MRGPVHPAAALGRVNGGDRQNSCPAAAWERVRWQTRPPTLRLGRRLGFRTLPQPKRATRLRSASGIDRRRDRDRSRRLPDSSRPPGLSSALPAAGLEADPWLRCRSWESGHRRLGHPEPAPAARQGRAPLPPPPSCTASGPNPERLGGAAAAPGATAARGRGGRGAGAAPGAPTGGVLWWGARRRARTDGTQGPGGPASRRHVYVPRPAAAAGAPAPASAPPPRRRRAEAAGARRRTLPSILPHRAGPPEQGPARARAEGAGA